MTISRKCSHMCAIKCRGFVTGAHIPRAAIVIAHDLAADDALFVLGCAFETSRSNTIGAALDAYEARDHDEWSIQHTYAAQDYTDNIAYLSAPDRCAWDC